MASMTAPPPIASPQASIDPSGWPCSKLEANIATVTQCGESLASTAVLLSTGALNPVHVGHLSMMETAQAYLQQQHVTVLAGFLSPSHDLYIKGKYSKDPVAALSAASRCEFVDAATLDSPWLATGRWESLPAHTQWPDFPEVAASLQQHIAKHPACQGLPAPPLVVYVCGYDHAKRCSLMRGMGGGLGVLVMPRQEGTEVAEAQSNPSCLVWGVPASFLGVATHASVSSTLVRQRLQAGGGIGDLVPPALDWRLRSLPNWDPLPPPRRRAVFVTATGLYRQWRQGEVPSGVLEDALFLFGSKRCWLFPSLDWHRAEALASGGGYLSFDSAFIELVRSKEARGEVLFLKADLPGDAADSGGSARCDYTLVGPWLTNLRDAATGRAYNPPQLDAGWWQAQAPKDPRWSRCVLSNITQGMHDYGGVCALVAASNPRSLWPVVLWGQKDAAALQPADLPNEFASELRALEEMGFGDKQKNAIVLRKTAGDVAAAVEQLVLGG